MLLCFTLSMPGCSSWNGRWTGEGNLYARIHAFTGKAGVARAEAIVKIGYFRYSFGDGWAAGVQVKEISSDQARKIRKASKGFAGYDWMITSIRDHMEIRGEIHDRDGNTVGYQNSAGKSIYTDGRVEIK